jgi:7-carboxy-7-deazaguanine synthase
MLKVNEIFGPTIQGEGIDAGLPAQFIRLSGCNLSCKFCDTDFLDSEVMTENDIIKKLKSRPNLIVITGGEPLTQNIEPLLQALKANGFRVGLETNGTLPIPENAYRFIDSISLSPKVSSKKCKVKFCHSLKILYPFLKEVTPESYKEFVTVKRYFQPIDYGCASKNKAILERLLKEMQKYPDYRVGFQLHKLVGLK